MTTRLEDELAAGLREHAAGLHLGRDVLAAARRRHRRRTAVVRAVSVTGTLGVAGVVAAAVAVTGSPGSVPGPRATSPLVTPTAPAGVRLDVATVSARVSQALTDTGDLVLHVDSRATLGGRTARSHLWLDPVSDRLRKDGDRLPGAPRSDELWETRDGEQVITHVDHDDRTWWRDVVVDVDRSAEEPAAGRPRDLSVDGLRAALRRGEFVILGRERLGGRETVHLRLSDRPERHGYDLWVDAGTFALVRKVRVNADGTPLRVQEDYEYLPRSAEVLAELELEVPAGYHRVPVPG
jgi:hypothetical protein